MSMKEWLLRLQPAPLHLMLVLSVIYFIAQMIICHLTHALTLLLDSCHMLCNIIALVGCIITVKYEAKVPPKMTEQGESLTNNSKVDISGVNSDHVVDDKKQASNMSDEKRLRNTFGWTRIEVLMMLVVCVFFASLCFTVVLESLQTLVHIGHMDAMHNPFIVLCMGAVGLLLNGFCYLLIGGYTFHQGSFLHVTASGDVVLESVVSADSMRQGQRRLSRSRRSTLPPPQPRQRQGLLEATRDIISCVFVIFCALVVYFIDISLAKFVDPALAIVSSFVLLFLTYPYLRESGLILLQTIPESMNIEALNAELLKTFPDIVNIHDFHVWQLTSSKVVLTAHIIFQDPLNYTRQCDEVKEFLMEQGITQVTIQPEFKSADGSQCSAENQCLMTCKGKGCINKHCCRDRESISNPSPIMVVATSEKEADESSTTESVSNAQQPSS